MAQRTFLAAFTPALATIGAADLVPVELGDNESAPPDNYYRPVVKNGVAEYYEYERAGDADWEAGEPVPYVFVQIMPGLE